MITIFHSPLSQSHVACTLLEEVMADDRLLRSEMICALSIIREQMRLKAYLNHQIFPVRYHAPYLPGFPRVMINADAEPKGFGVFFLRSEGSGCAGTF